MIELKKLVKRYKMGRKKPDVVALKGISVTLPDTGMIFVLGKSGSGKSTFLNVVGGLDSFEDGDLILFGKSAKEFTDEDYNSYRNKYVGFIFQEYNIIDTMTVRRNVELAVELQNKVPDPKEIDRILQRVGLLDLADRMPSQLSGGQKQRIAIARAIIKHPQIILADEPTGALDSFNTEEIFKLLQEISKERLVVCVTHDAACAEKYADRIIRINKGEIVADITRRTTEGEKVEGSDNLTQLGTGLIKIDKPTQLDEADIKALAAKAGSDENPAYYAYGDHVRIPAELAEGDDSLDTPVGFTDTTPADIEANSSKKRVFKKIKAHMRSKTLFNFGLDMMKHSPGRLAMTIVLSLISFVMMGVGTIVSTYNPAQTFADSGNIYRPNATIVEKYYLGNEDKGTHDTLSSLITEEEFNNNIRASYPTAIPVYPAITGNLAGNMVNPVGYDGSDWFKPEVPFVGVLESESQIESFGFTLEGDLPKDNEIVITDYALWTIERGGFVKADGTVIPAGTELKASDIIGQEISVSSFVEYRMKVSGVLHTDISEDQIVNDIPKAQVASVDTNLMLRDNYDKGPLRMFFLNKDGLGNANIQNAINMGSEFTMSKAFIPTLSNSGLKEAYYFSENHYATDNQDGTDIRDYVAGDYAGKRYRINSKAVDQWIESATVTSTLNMVRSVAMIVAIVLGVIAILVTMNFLFTSVNTKIREIGILKGLGASSHEIFGIFVIEAMFIATINFAFSCLFSWLIGNWANSLLQTLFSMPLSIVSFNWITALVLLVISFGISLISALIPSYTVAGMKPADAMKRGA